MAKTFESMEEHMLAPNGNKCGPSSRLSELGIELPAPPTPLGAYVESSDVGNLLFLSGMLPMVNRKLAVSGRFGENLSVSTSDRGGDMLDQSSYERLLKILAPYYIQLRAGRWPRF